MYYVRSLILKSVLKKSNAFHRPLFFSKLVKLSLISETDKNEGDI